MTVEDLDKVDPHMACTFFNMNFRNPAEFTVFMTGQWACLYNNE